MNTQYEVILKCKQEKKMPVISPYMISKNQFDRIQEIVHENDRKSNEKYQYNGRKGE